ncbi:MAG: type II toxin-antitoxin system PemK/MazF family toxin [Melioribacteraceae bacterium]
MKKLERGMLIDVNLDPALGSETGRTRPCIIVTNDIYNERIPVIQVVPVTSWNDKKSLVRTNVEIEPTPTNGLNKKSIADCLQTRPIDYRERLKKVRGKLSSEVMKEIDEALAVVFDLCKKE